MWIHSLLKLSTTYCW